ncbi:MAG: phosphatase [Atopobiaceae bacterium]|jgi:putative hydrolase|nr:phosphatase [Atopobiaceae bacterium]MCI2173583.1 phosphatase [Atopobiaceae bacterium]MCI2207775.1 phosphatase [Atopobiaceae bacterium]
MGGTGLTNLCDVHTHTVFTRHAYSTIEENVRAASEAGLELLGSADHFSDMMYPADDYRDWQYFINMAAWPREWHGVRLLHGIECDIVDLSGHLFGWDVPVADSIVGDARDSHRTLYESIVPRQDYAIASIHGKVFCKGATQGSLTDMYVGALDDPHVLILGHTGRSGIDFDIDTVLAHAKQTHKLIEINEHSFGSSRHIDGRCRDIACRCAEMGVQIAVNTDAHISCAVGRFDQSLDLLESIHFPQELVATRSAEAFLAAREAALGPLGE